MNLFNYSQAKLNQIFSDVKVLYQDDGEEVMKEYVLRGFKRLLEGAMKAEVVGYLRARCYERTGKRVDYRNGYRYRDLSREWCADWYDESYYGRSANNNPKGPSSGEYRVLRGGSWYFVAWVLRSADRTGVTPPRWWCVLGFRVASSP